MRAQLLLAPCLWLTAALLTQAQSEFNKGKSILETLKLPHGHFVPGGCKDRPDGVYMKSFGTYSGCVHGKEVCSQEKGAIPKALIERFDAGRKEFDERARLRQLEGNSPTARSRPGGAKSRTETPIPVAAPVAPPAALADELLSEIAAGADRGAMVDKLGRPYMKISGDVERYTYRLASGRVAKIDVESGRVTQIKIVTQ